MTSAVAADERLIGVGARDMLMAALDDVAKQPLAVVTGDDESPLHLLSRRLRLARGQPVLDNARAEAHAVGADGNRHGKALGFHLAPNGGAAEPSKVLDFTIG